MNKPSQAEERARRGLLMLVGAIVESVDTAGRLGAPGGTLYQAMAAHGATLMQFNQVMAAIVASGRLVRRGHLYFTPANA